MTLVDLGNIFVWQKIGTKAAKQQVRNEDFTLKQTPHKNMQMEVNDVIFKMADFAQF